LGPCERFSGRNCPGPCYHRIVDLLEQLRARLTDRPEILFATLFGSQASGIPRSGSDVDIGVFLKEDLSAGERFDKRVELSNELEDLGRADVVVLNDAPPLLGHRALMGKQLIMRDRKAYVRYFVRTLSASEDDRYWRDIHAKERKRRLEEGTFGRP
jgi:predicted nucleotidyltransferase